jgi:structural maintenance of chromosome 4
MPLQSFSSVVGPNGSGKSNVIDAMLFVFGKRAKQLRLNKVSELIHNSTHHRNLQQARVSVHFEEIIDADDEQCTVVPNSQFVISRTAHRSNASNYYIDDRKSNFTEVTELLKGKGVDLDNNRFLILQVEQLCLSMAIYGFRAFAAWQMYYQRIRFASNDSIL